MSRHLTEIPREFTLDIIIEYKFDKNLIKDIHGRLECSENHYCISFTTSEDSSNIISLGVNEFMYGKFNKAFKIKECKLEGKLIKIDTGDSYITHMRQFAKVGCSQTERILYIDKFRIIKDCAKIEKESFIKYYLSNCGDKLKEDFQYSIIQLDKIIRNSRNFTYKEMQVILGYDNAFSAPYIELHEENEKKLYEFLCLLSFYYMRPIKYWKREKLVKKEIVCDFNTIYVSFSQQLNRFNEWNHFYIENTKPNGLIKQQRIKLENLLSYANKAFNDTSSLKYKIVLKAIHNFVDILCDSEQSQLVFYVNILSTLAEKLHNYCKSNSASNIKKLFKEADISFNRIDDELQKKDFHKTIIVPDECKECQIMIRKNKISTFVDLRNEFVHGLPSMEMLDYVHDSLLLSRLKMAVFKTLLYELGVEGLRYYIPNDPLNIQK